MSKRKRKFAVAIFVQREYQQVSGGQQRLHQEIVTTAINEAEALGMVLRNTTRPFFGWPVLYWMVTEIEK